MTTACLLTVLVCGAPAPSSVCLSTCGSITVVANTSLPFRLRRSRNELRSDYRNLRRAADRSGSDPLALTPQLVALYVELSDPGALPYGERKVKFQAMRLRLIKIHKKLVAIAKKSKSRTRTPRDVEASPSAAGGAGTMARANQLIGLIQSTIQPNSWDVNGGDNTIRFYAPLNVLVVRASAEVHEQIGGVLPNLKP